MRNQFILSVISFSLLLAVSGCKVDAPVTVNAKVEPNGDITARLMRLSCAVSLNSSSNVVLPNTQIPLTMQAAGGTAPYTVTGFTGSFISQLTFTKSYANSTTSNLTVEDTYEVSDSTGSKVTCGLSLTVSPSVPVSNLACAMTTSTSNPKIDDSVVYTMVASGGTSPYTFSNFTAGNSGTVQSGLTVVNASTSTASAKYASAGLSSASVTLSDFDGTVVTCSKNITVKSAPAISLSASPSTTVSSNSTITLTPTVTDFAGSPSIQFSSLSAGIQFTGSGNSLIVSTTDLLSRVADITATATTSTETATTTIRLNFTATPTLNCNITHASGSFNTGETVAFNISATNGEALQVMTFTAPNGLIMDYSLGQSMHVQFTTGGTKQITATAKSLATGALCNAGALLTDSITIRAPLSCSATTAYNPSYAGEFFLARAIIPANAGVGRVRLTNIQTSIYANVSYGYDYDDLSTYLAIYNSGSFPIVLTVQDESGQTATCSTTQVVY